jgi:hypothetical protein
MKKKIIYGMFGFVLGFLVASTFFMAESKAQFDGDADAAFQEDIMTPHLPGKYGQLIAVYDINMYFQAQDGTIYIVKPLRGSQLDTHVSVIKRR